MKWKLTSRAAPRVYVVTFETDDNVLPLIRDFSVKEDLHSAHFTGIGAFRWATLAFYELGRKDYRLSTVEEQVEVLGFNGNLTRNHGKPSVHAHAVLGRSDGQTLGGHLHEAVVRPSLELVVNEIESEIERHVDEKTGLPLIKLDD